MYRFCHLFHLSLSIQYLEKRLMKMREKDYYTIPEAAEFCSVSRSTMWRWVKSGKVLASTTLGGQHRIQKNHLQAVLAEKGVYPHPGNGKAKQTEISETLSSQKKILIVDDEPQFRKLMKRILSSRGYQIMEASDGFEAGIQIIDFKPDLVLLDLYIPGMDGFEVCRKIKENPKTAIIVVVAVTGYDNDENRERIMKAGADGYLTKPVDRVHLLAIVEKFLLVPDRYAVGDGG
jgi:excisionase family DNA binding protein